MSSFEPSDLPRRPAPQAEASSGSITAGRPEHYVEFHTPPDPVSQQVGTFPALAQPKAGRKRPPRQRRHPRIVVSVPMWVILGLGLLALVAALLLLPTITPWPRSPALPSVDDTSPGAGVIGTAGPNGEQSAGSGATASSGTTPNSAAAPTSTNPDGGSPPTGAGPLPQITYFTATPLVGGLIGYDLEVRITNGATVSQDWRNVSTHINGVPVGVTVTEPSTGVRGVVANNRICLEPTDPVTTTLDPGQTLTMKVRLTLVSLGQAPRQGQLNDSQCPASASS
jgi:hypothetical protein